MEIRKLNNSSERYKNQLLFWAEFNSNALSIALSALSLV